MNKTKIEWVKNPDGTSGYTWNPITGCLNHTNGLCNGGGFPCYAYKLANGRLRQRYLANENVAGNETMTYPRHIECMADPFYPRFWEERLFDPINWSRYGGSTIGHPKGIFVCDMGELFGDWIPQEWQDRIFTIIKSCVQHRFYLLTKQPQNLIKWSPFPSNCWVGVTVTEPFPKNTPLAYLAKVEASIKFISFEPLLKWTQGITNQLVMSLEKAGVDWVIIGAQTKPTVYPKNTWVWEIEQACEKAGIPVFEKNNLYPAGFRHLLRQELPRLKEGNNDH